MCLLDDFGTMCFCNYIQVLILVLAIIVRAVNQAAESGSDDELMGQRQQIWQPLINRFRPPAGQGPDQRPTGADAWSTRLREKVLTYPSMK